jgi:nucleotide-binding universal stress UspA family protein
MKRIQLSEIANLGIGDTRGVAVTETNVRHAERSEFRRDCRTKPRKGSSLQPTPTILVAVDFLPASLKAVEHAFVWAKQLHASILLLHVVDPIYTGGFVNLVTRQKVRREARRRALERINTLANSHADESVPVTCVLRDGLPEIEILQLAEKENVNVIILGRQPKNPLGRWILGSVSDDIIDLAPCPVVLVNSRAGARIQGAWA